MTLYAIALAQLFSGLVGDAEGERQQRAARALLELRRIQESPPTVFRLVNRSGRPIDTVLVDCWSDPKRPTSFQEHARQAGPYGKESTLLHRVWWPEPFVLEAVTLVGGGRKDVYLLKVVCRPGRCIRIVVDEKGEVTAREDP